jgi:hypothetical protein
MRQKLQTRQTGVAKAIKDIRRATRKQFSAEEKIRIVLDGLRGQETIAELCANEFQAITDLHMLRQGLPEARFTRYRALDSRRAAAPARNADR